MEIDVLAVFLLSVSINVSCVVLHAWGVEHVVPAKAFGGSLPRMAAGACFSMQHDCHNLQPAIG